MHRSTFPAGVPRQRGARFLVRTLTALLLLPAVAAVATGCRAVGGAPPTGPSAPDVRWFVAVDRDGRPAAERHALGPADRDGLRILTVYRAASFAALDPLPLETPRTTVGIVRNADGRWSVALDADGRLAAPAVLDVPAAPAAGAAWGLATEDGGTLEGRVVGREPVTLPGGHRPEAWRVEVVRTGGPRLVTWYDDDLRPLRSEVRDEDGRLLEARARVAGREPDAGACREAVRWARRTWGSPAARR